MDLIVSGFLAILRLDVLLLVLIGTFIGLFVGVVPGLTATMALALLVPFTFVMEPLLGLVLLGAIYMAAMYGGAFTAILINTPGTPAAIATQLDGYPMATSGRAEEAIVGATIASVIGGLVGFLALLLLAPPLTQVALRFGPPEFFWIAVLGLALIAALSQGSLLKGLLGGALGMLLGTIGISMVGGESRFLFGLPALQGGIELIVALIALFAVPEFLRLTATAKKAVTGDFAGKRASLGESSRRILAMPVNLARSSLIGLIIGIIPGAGNNVAGLLAYNEAKRVSKRPERFGKGAIEGVVASESSNNAAVAGSMVPLLTLGVPGSPPAAVIFGALMLHGLRPGTELFTVSGQLTYGFIFSLGLAAIALLPVGILGGRAIYRAVASLPLGFLVPTIGFMTILGAYSIRNSIVDVFIMIGLGIAAYGLREIGIQPAPIALGLILGPIAEQGFVQSLLLGTAYAIPWLKLFESPLSLGLVALVVLSLVWPFLQQRLSKRKKEYSGDEGY